MATPDLRGLRAIMSILMSSLRDVSASGQQESCLSKPNTQDNPLRREHTRFTLVLRLRGHESPLLEAVVCEYAVKLIYACIVIMMK